MVVTRIDVNARQILEDVKKEMKESGIEQPNLSDAIRYMKKQIKELQTSFVDKEKAQAQEEDKAHTGYHYPGKR